MEKWKIIHPPQCPIYNLTSKSNNNCQSCGAELALGELITSRDSIREKGHEEERKGVELRLTQTQHIHPGGSSPFTIVGQRQRVGRAREWTVFGGRAVKWWMIYCLLWEREWAKTGDLVDKGVRNVPKGAGLYTYTICYMIYLHKYESHKNVLINLHKSSETPLIGQNIYIFLHF